MNETILKNRQLKKQLAIDLKRISGLDIEITIRPGSAFTLSVEGNQIHRFVGIAFFIGPNVIWEPIFYSTELDYTFAFFTLK